MRTVHCSTLFHSTATQPESDVCDVSIPEMSKSVRLALKTKYSGSILTPECWSIDFHLDDNMPASVSRGVSWSGRCQRDGCTASQRVENAVHCSVACVRLGVLSRHARQLNGSALRALSLPTPTTDVLRSFFVDCTAASVRRYRSITIRPRPSTRSSPDIYTPGAHPSPDIANFCAAIIQGLDIGLLFTVMVGVIVIRVRG